jgi:uncharacterized membrane protein
MRAERLGWVAIAGLLGLIAIWHLWWLPPKDVPAALAVALHALPLLPAILMLVGNKHRALLVGAMGALALFSHGVMEAMTAPEARLAGSLEIALSLLLIGAACWNGLYRRFARTRAS